MPNGIVVTNGGVVTPLIPDAAIVTPAQIANNIVDSLVSRPYRASNVGSGAATWVFDIDLTDPIPAGAKMGLHINRHNVLDGTITLELFSGGGAVSEQVIGPVDIGSSSAASCEVNLDRWGYFVWGNGHRWGIGAGSDLYFRSNTVWFTTVAIPSAAIDSVKVTISANSTSPSTFFEVNRLILGQYFQPVYNFSKGYSFGIAETGKSFRTDGGRLVREFSHFYRTLGLNFSVIPESDRSIFYEMFLHCGLRTDLLVSTFPLATEINKEENFTMLAKFTKPFIFSQIVEDFYSLNVAMEES